MLLKSFGFFVFMDYVTSEASNSARSETLPDTVFSLGISCLILSTLSGTLLFWSDSGPVLFSALRESAVVGLCALLAAFALARGKIKSIRLNSLGLAWGITAVFLTDWMLRPYNLLQGDYIRGEIILGSLLAVWALRNQAPKILASLFPLTVLLLVFSFLSEAHGRLLFSDDNPTFIYRLLLLQRNFPFLPFYNPLWNAGIEARDFFATGSLNVFLLFSPLIYCVDVFKVYNLIVITLLFGLLPVSLWLAARLLGQRAAIPGLAAVLGMSSSLLWYRWALKYGTLGFITSASLFVLNLALASRICDPSHRPRARELFFSIASFSLMIFWTPAGLACVPIAILALSRLPKLMRKRAFISFGVLLVMLNLPWITLFWKVSNVGNFVQSKRPNYAALADEKGPQYNYSSPSDEHINTRERTGTFSLAVALQRLRENSASTNPLLIFLGLPALFLYCGRGKWLLAGTSVWLIALGSVVSQLKPQLELDRMFVLLAILLCIPTAALLHRLWSSPLDRWYKLTPAALCAGFLFAGVFSTAAVLLNRSIERFYFAEPGIYKLAETIKAEAKGGRALFSGFVLHDLYHGHLAPLVQLAGTSLVASSPFHDQWQYKEIFPRQVLTGGDQAIEEYLSMMNATLVLAHEDRWKTYFSGHAEKYTELLGGSIFNLYRRNGYTSNYFLEGNGSLIEETSNHVTVRLESDRAVLKYRYYDFLQSSACSLARKEILPGLDFIELSGCPIGQAVTIQSQNPLTRLLSGGK